MQYTKKLQKPIFEKEGNLKKDEEYEVQTIEDPNIEMMKAVVIASLPSTLNQAITTSSVDQLQKNKKSLPSTQVGPELQIQSTFGTTLTEQEPKDEDNIDKERKEAPLSQPSGEEKKYEEKGK